MHKTLHQQFIRKLEEKYGPQDSHTAKFGSSSFGQISDQLCISASLFSKLIAGTATEGMYQRAIKNVDRLIREKAMQQQVDASDEELRHAEVHLTALARKTRRQRTTLLSLVAVLLLAAGAWLFLPGMPGFEQADAGETSPHPLSDFFDRKFTSSFNSPYVSYQAVQDFCPASAYEGIWSLAQPYKLPIPGRRPGLYYAAKSADVRMKCSRTDTLSAGKGKVLLGYEYLVNEIWLDTERTPLSPTYFDKETKQFTEAFDQLDMAQNPQFRKVATIYSFFIDRFELRGDSIYRYGEPCGRYASDADEALIASYEIDLSYLLEQVLADMTTTRCEGAANPYCDPNQLTEHQSVISFNCLYTISNENLGFGGGYPYQKGYRLENQHYSDNLICDCGS
jgi:hypothetical protein